MEAFPFYNGKSIITTELSSYDGSEYFELQKTILYDSNFFLSDELIFHRRIAYNILDLLSEFGGLVGIIFSIIGSIGTNMNYNFIVGKFIKEFYYYNDKGEI